MPAKFLNVPSEDESGLALLLSVLILTLIMGILAATSLSLSKVSVMTAAQASTQNAARVAAMIGVSAILQDAQTIYKDDGGNSMLGVGIPVGTTASAAIKNAAPYFQGNVSSTVTANTCGTKESSGEITILSTGTSGNATATVEAIITSTDTEAPTLTTVRLGNQS